MTGSLLDQHTTPNGGSGRSTRSRGNGNLAADLAQGFAWLDRAFMRPACWYGAIVLLGAIQLALIFWHEPWRDELQALLIATEASSQAELLAWLRYEGHPPAWYWLLQALSRVMPTDLVLPLAALLCAVVTQAIILFAAPFSRVERLLLASSQYVLFEFLTIARGTSLGVAFILAVLALWRTRWVWLLFAMLPMVDFLFGVISGVFVLLKWRERGLWWPGIALWLAGGLFAAWTVMPPADMVSASAAMQMAAGPFAWLVKIGSLPLPFQGGIMPQWNTPVVPIAPFAWLLMLWLCWDLSRGFAWHRLLIFGFFGLTLAFSMLIYPIGLRHLMLGSLLLIALQWRQRELGAPEGLTLKVWLAALALCGIVTGAISTTRGFDSGDAVIEAIERRGLADKTWIALPEWHVPAIAGRSEIAFIRPAENCRFRFVRWDHQPVELHSRRALENVLARHIAIHGRSYLLSDQQFEGFDDALVRQLEHVPAGYDGIGYYLYVVGEEARETPRPVPRCDQLAPRPPSDQSLGKK